MSTMYSRSVAMLRQAKNAILSVLEDDAFLDVACFETQQAVEFLTCNKQEFSHLFRW